MQQYTASAGPIVEAKEDLQQLEIDTFEIDDLSDLDVKAPFSISTSSTISTSSSCG